MNSRQKSYDRYDQINRLMKISNNYYLYKSIESISNRKGRYPYYLSISPKKLPNINKNNNRMLTEPYSKYSVKKENQAYQKILNDIRFHPSKPRLKPLDNLSIGINKRMDDYRRNTKKMEDKLLAIRNENYKRRINMQKGVINIKKFNDSYNQNLKVLNNIRKIPSTRSIILPPIAVTLRRNKTAKRLGVHERKNSSKGRRNDINSIYC